MGDLKCGEEHATIMERVFFSEAKGVQNHLEERLLDQAQARGLIPPLFGVIRAAYPKA